MNKLIDSFSDVVKGSVAGFDRIVFKGIMLASDGAMNFFPVRHIFFKDSDQWMVKQISQLMESAEHTRYLFRTY